MKLDGLLRRVAIALLCLWCLAGPLAAASRAQTAAPFPQPAGEPTATSLFEQLESFRNAAVRLPFATLLASVLAYRPRRRGTPARQLAVIQTQIILAIVGAMVMLVVGASLARAFGIVGAAGLIRYRAKIDDPKDAGVMLCTLALGLAAGVGLYFVAVFGAAFLLLVLWILESLEPEPTTLFEMTVVAKETPELKAAIEQTLRRHRLLHEMKTAAPDGISYEVRVPLKRDTDVVSKAIAALDPKQSVDVKWEKKKDK